MATSTKCPKKRAFRISIAGTYSWTIRDPLLECRGDGAPPTARSRAPFGCRHQFALRFFVRGSPFQAREKRANSRSITLAPTSTKKKMEAAEATRVRRRKERAAYFLSNSDGPRSPLRCAGVGPRQEPREFGWIGERTSCTSFGTARVVLVSAEPEQASAATVVRVEQHLLTTVL